MTSLRVDAYTAVVDDHPNEVLQWLCEALPERERVMVGREGGIKPWRYEHAVGINDGKTPVAAVRWGGNGGGACIELKGSVAHDTFGLLRARYADHSCSRMDVAIDRSAPGLFDLAHAALMAIAQEQNPVISSEPAGAGWDQPGKYGRTKYFGSKESPVRLCLYEKGFERVQRGGLKLDEVDLDHVRFEARITPDKRAHKVALSQAVPLAVMGWRPWLASMFEAYSGIEAQAVDLPVRPRDEERTWNAFLMGYAPFLDDQIRKHGLEAVMAKISAYNDLKATSRKRKVSA